MKPEHNSICNGGNRHGELFTVTTSKPIRDRDKRGRVVGHYVKTSQLCDVTGCVIWNFQKNK